MLGPSAAIGALSPCTLDSFWTPREARVEAALEELCLSGLACVHIASEVCSETARVGRLLFTGLEALRCWLSCAVADHSHAGRGAQRQALRGFTCPLIRARSTQWPRESTRVRTTRVGTVGPALAHMAITAYPCVNQSSQKLERGSLFEQERGAVSANLAWKGIVPKSASSYVRLKVFFITCLVLERIPSVVGK